MLLHFEYNRWGSPIGMHSLVRRFDLASGVKIAEFSPGRGQIADVSADGRLALVLEDDFRWRMWESRRTVPSRTGTI